MEIRRPETLAQALEIKAEQPDAVPLAGGTDLMVAINFRETRPGVVLDLTAVPELAEWAPDDGRLRVGAGVTYTRLIEELGDRLPALAIASRTVGSPQIRNRGTIGGNLGTASPAGDALPPLLVEGAEVELAKVGGTRSVPLDEFLVGPKRNALAEDELIVGVRLSPSKSRQTFMKIGPRNAMVIAVCSLALAVDREREEIRAAYGSAGPVPALVTAPLADRAEFPERLAAAASPIDDVRGTAAYRRHALKVLTGRALERVLT
jgi:CO/xanthine dehydrogenase FAD-binding subunit